MMQVYSFLKNIIKNKRGGTVLLMTMLMLTAVLTTSLAMGNIVRNGLTMSWTQLHSVKAYFAAEAGLERMLWEIRKNGEVLSSVCNDGQCIRFNVSGDINGCDGGCGNVNKQFDLSNGAWFRIQYNESGADIVLSSLGTYENVHRVVQITYTE